MFTAIGRFAYRRRWPVIVVWAALFAFGLLSLPGLSGNLKGGGFTAPDAPAQQALELMRQRLDTGLATMNIVFTSDSWAATSPEFQAAEQKALAGLTPTIVPGLVAVQTYANTGDRTLLSEDGSSSIAVAVFRVPLGTAQRRVDDVRDAMQASSLTSYVTGEPAVYSDMEQVSSDDLKRAESYALPFALLILLIVFGSVVAASLPVIGGGAAVAVTLGVMTYLAQAFDLSIFVMNTASMLGLAVGIDYALFMVGRFREELGNGRPVGGAVEVTVARAGRAIFFSGVAVVVGLLGLLAFPYMAMRSIGIGGSLVVLFSMASALTLLPALLGVLGPRVNALRLFGRRGAEGRFWERWSDWVMRHPVVTLLGTVAIVLALAAPVLRIETNVPTAESLPEKVESRAGYDLIQERFRPAALDPIYVLVTWEGGGDVFAPEHLAKLAAFGRELAAQEGVAAVTSVVNQPGLEDVATLARFWQAVRVATGGQPASQQSGSEESAPTTSQSPPPAPTTEQLAAAERLMATTTAPGTVLFTVVPKVHPTSDQAQNLAVALREMTPPAGMTVHVAGLSGSIHDFVSSLYDRFPWVIAFIMAVTYLVLLVLLRSVVLPLKAVIMNTLSILASFGALVYIFQDGNLESVLDFASVGYVDATLPVIMFCTVFGVSMDYEVFLLTRMREAWLETGDNQKAVGFGLARTGRIITSAALIIVIVAGAFSFTDIVVTKAIGIGLAVAIALDATIVRVLLVPATMRLLGRVNWWLPEWLGRILPRVGEE